MSNPSIRIYREIDGVNIMNVEYVIHGFGFEFGFDETNDDYKIIRVMTHYPHKHHEMMREISVIARN